MIWILAAFGINLYTLTGVSSLVEKNMEIFHVASMRAGKIFDKTWKIQSMHRKFLQNKTSMQHAKFPKLQRILRNFIELVKEF